jgi:hypothetical protein
MQASVPALLTVAFAVLKLCHVIAWSWIWVLLPFWGPIAIGIAVIVGALELAVIEVAFRENTRRRKPKTRSWR